MTDRPEDIANRQYYNHEMKMRRVRVTYEVDIEWREHDPNYCLDVARGTYPYFGVRGRNVRQISADIIGEPHTVNELESVRS